jgi:hypothetical protein
MFCFLRYRETLPPRPTPEEKLPRRDTILLIRFIGDPPLINGYRDKAILPIMERWVAAELNGSVSGRQIPLWNSANHWSLIKIMNMPLVVRRLAQEFENDGWGWLL